MKIQFKNLNAKSLGDIINFKIVFVIVAIVFISGCASGGVGKFLTDISRQVPGEAGKSIRISGTAIRAIEEQAAKQRRIEQQRQAKMRAEQERIRQQKERQEMLARMSPQQRAQFLKREQEAEIARNKAVIGIFGAVLEGMLSGPSGGTDDSYGCYERGTCACQNDPKCVQAWQMQQNR
jgi:Cdc6-like AAA superfamily ATPase